MKYRILLFLVMSGFSMESFSEPVSTPQNRKNISVTVYNQGFGLVRETRDINVPKGNSSLRFEGVASLILPETVRVKYLGREEDFSVYEQNYEYDLISSQKLLKKYVGKDVTIYKTIEKNGSTVEEPVKANIISFNDDLILKIGNEISLGYPGRVTVPTLPENLFSSPTLVWKILNNSNEKNPVEVSYQTNGMNWTSDYILVLSNDEKTTDITSWISLTNESGLRLEKATLQLVAGKVQRATPQYQNYNRYDLAGSSMRKNAAAEAAPAFNEEKLSEYYLYTLDQPTDIGENQKKQVKLFSADNVTVSKRLYFENLPMYSGDEKYFNNAAIRYEIKNSKDSGLGKALPAGTVRVFKADSKGRQQLLGEDTIDHTPNDELLKIKVGEAFDVVANGKQLKYENFTIGSGYVASYEVSLRNRKKEDITVRFYGNSSGEWKIPKSNFSFVKESSYKFYFDIPIKAGKEEKLTYTYEQKY